MDADIIVVGAGAIGTSVAYHAARDGHAVIVIEKEPGPALHQSGRNSGVIHAGYQYEPGSLKARFATDGAGRLKEYCRGHGIALDEGGLLVLARNEVQEDRLQLAAKRAKDNGVPASLVADAEIEDIEPHARGTLGLHVPSYASFDARGYVHALTSDAIRHGAEFLFDTRATGIEEGAGGARVVTDKGVIEARAAVNAAGLYADRLAGDACRDMRIVPFRGYYTEVRPRRRELVRSHVYPAPDPELPFLGVHFSRRADGRVIVGPGAMLAFGREAYRFHQVNLRDLWTVLTWPGFYRLIGSKRVRRLVRSEVQKSLSLRAIWREARRLVPDIAPDDLVPSFAGNRAQMVDRDGNLVMDLIVREDGHTVHVLNAISPGLTCSLPFGEHVAKRAAALV